MPEREKVMKGLKHHSGQPIPTPCDNCPYDDEEPYCSQRLAADALALLREQDEGIEPEISRKSVTETTASLWYICGACGGAIEQGDDEFCRHCGRKVKWND